MIDKLLHVAAALVPRRHGALINEVPALHTLLVHHLERLASPKSGPTP